MKGDVVFFGKKRVRLQDRDLIGEGGEGRVYRAFDRAVKVFNAANPERESKLRAFPPLPPRVVAPLELCTDGSGAVVGFSMRMLDGAVDLHRFGQRRWREARVSNAETLRLFRDLAETVEEVHRRGVVVGDLNDGNVVVTPPPSSSSPGAARWAPWMIDADSMQFGAHRCVVAHERFLDPRLYGVDLGRDAALSRETDWYALAVLLFGALLYVHPFGGAHPSYPTMLRRAEGRCSVLRAGVKLPSAAARPDVLPDDALGWFERVFERDVREPLPASILEARFVRCSCGAEHARTTCPVCALHVQVAPVVRARGRIRATRVFATKRGRIVTATVSGGLKHAHEEDGVLYREDGSVVLRSDGDDPIAAAFFREPNRFVRIAGSATWIGARGRLARIACERVLDTLPVGLVHGEIAADATMEGLVYAHGDALLRSASGTRAGQLLEGQTHVRVGASLGFAFYRAGEITVAFVFDPRRGPLRQIDSFPRIEGKLLGWSAVFDDAHVLVTFATENAGPIGQPSVIEHTALLVTERGEILASERGRGTTPLTASLSGRAVAGDGVLAATDDGLVLLRAAPDGGGRRAFVATRLFPEAKDFVSPDAELLIGPGGSLFVVTHDEITHLCFTS
jgi:hypothetical protein